MESLKPCPFCGGRAYLERSSRGFINGESTRIAYVRCTKCEARSGRAKLTDYGHTSSSSEAVNAVVERWNKRYETEKTD